MIKRVSVVPVLAVLGLAACGDSSPTAIEPPLDEVAFELVAEAALDANDQQGTPLPSLENLLRRTYKAIQAEGGHGQAVRLLKAGKPLNAIIAVLGPEVVDEALTGVDQALLLLDQRFAGKTLPDRMERVLNQAKTLAERGHAAVAAERYAGALSAALGSADLIRSLSSKYRARKAIERADLGFKAAKEAISVDPTDGEKATLKKAMRLLNLAKDAFKAKEYQKAWARARESAALSQKVLEGRSGG